MKRLEVKFGRKRLGVDVPESWQEMSGEQFVAVCSLADKKCSDAEFYSRFFGFPEDMLKEMDLYYFYVLNSLLGFTLKTQALSVFIIGKIGEWVSPNPMLSGMSFEQFMMIDTFFTWYLQLDDRKFLDRMCAVMYVRDDEEFADIDIEARTEEWSKVGGDVKQALLVNWSLIKRWLSKAYKHLFPEGDGDTVKRGSRRISNTWLEIFDALVADDLTRIEKYKRIDAMDVIRYVNNKIKNQR